MSQLAENIYKSFLIIAFPTFYYKTNLSIMNILVLFKHKIQFYGSMLALFKESAYLEVKKGHMITNKFKFTRAKPQRCHLFQQSIYAYR